MKYLLRSVCALNIFALIESRKGFVAFGLTLNDTQANNKKQNCDAVTVNFVVSMDSCLFSSLSLFLCIQLFCHQIHWKWWASSCSTSHTRAAISFIVQLNSIHFYWKISFKLSGKKETSKFTLRVTWAIRFWLPSLLLLLHINTCV